MLIGNIFLVNLFIAVLRMFYQQNEEKRRNTNLTREQNNWKEIVYLAAEENDDFWLHQEPSNKFRKFLYRLIQGDANGFSGFDTFILICIILNVASLAMAYEGSPSSYDDVLASSYFF